ncbi:hypothetical protein FB565_007652 [Actinoplanes lutulentus]|uniref:Uncharacterized protein n=1 Tax=Actinoplanes lutulentus TaxID=1287878 RepID=A0A327ZI03_9ACTN|nr:hypothetical protein [Actinoplanes lutulentus]MBB2947881.1 hypothetical protein [Actinoplanes lutulentus]RAK40238.1 hypothetical protein B0I29_103270 [Actinoplanes lutulentus]
MTDRDKAPESSEGSRLTVMLLAAAALAWTAAMLWSARVTITGRANAEMEVTSTAYALPGAVSADLVAGAAVALLVLTLIGSRRTLGATVRFAVATGAGLLVGVLSAVTMITINTAGSLYAIVGGTVAAAATIGGALAGFRIPRVITAAVAASVGVFVLGFVLNLFQSPVLDLLGADDTASSANAAQWFSYGQAALSGLAAGLIAYFLLRKAEVKWPFYTLAGAGPGLVVVIGEILSRTAGAEVLELAGKVSPLDQLAQQILSTARLNSGLVVLFVGAMTAMLAVGRTLSPTDEDETEAATEQKATEKDEPEENEGQVSSSSSETAYHSNS